jgi:hypothetical protein
MPAKVLFHDRESDTDSYENIASVSVLSPFKPSLDVTLPGLAGHGDKLLAKHVQRVEDSLSAVTQNQIHQEGVLQDQDKILRDWRPDWITYRTIWVSSHPSDFLQTLRLVPLLKIG